MTAAQQTKLFGDGMDAPTRWSVPEQPVRRGRGATPRVVFDWRAPRANPSGRSWLRFAFRPLHDRLDEICGSRPRSDSSCPLPQREPDAAVVGLETGAAELGSDDASRRLRLLGSHVAAAARDAGWYTKVWDALPDRRRRLVIAALEGDFAQYVRTFAPWLDPADVWLDALRLEWCSREAVRRRGVPEGAGERCMSVA